MEKSELIIFALQQRIGEIVSSYEGQLAVLRAEITELINEKKQNEKDKQEYSDHIASIVGKET